MIKTIKATVKMHTDMSQEEFKFWFVDLLKKVSAEKRDETTVEFENLKQVDWNENRLGKL
jgi:hypothetical protein